MLEILALILLCNVNSKNAVKRGRKPGAFVLLTLVLWIGMEVLGAAIGAAADMGAGMYGLAILFAAIGAVASYLIARNCKPGPHVDPLQAAANGTAAQVPPQMSQPLQPPQGASGAQGGFCVMCGAPLAADATVCGSCGAPCAPPVAAGGQQAFGSSPTPVPPQPSVSPQVPVPSRIPDPSQGPVPPQPPVPPQAAATRLQQPPLRPQPPGQNASAVPGQPVFPAQMQVTSVPQTQAAPAQVRTMSPEPTRAIRAGIVVAASWVVLFLVQGIFHRGLQYNANAPHYLAYALLGVGVYLFALRDGKLRVAGGVFGGAFALTYMLSSYALHARLFLRTGYVYLSTSMSLPTDLLIRFVGMLLCAALVLAVTIPAREALKQASASRGLLVDAGAAAVTFSVYLFIYTVVRRLLSSSSASSLGLLSSLLWCVVDGAVLFMTVYLLSKLCTADMQDLRLRGLGLVWAWIGVIGASCSLVILVYTGIVERNSMNYASALLLAAFALVGYLMLLRGKRLGLYIVVGGSVFILVSQFFASFDTVLASRDTKYLSLLLGSVVGVLNPALAWIAVRYSSDVVSVPAHAAEGPSAREMVFHAIAAVVNIIMGMVFILSVFFALLNGESVGILPILVILPIGVVFVVCGVVALVLRRSKVGGYPNWMRVFGTVMFALSALVVLFVLFMLLNEAVR